MSTKKQNTITEDTVLELFKIIYFGEEHYVVATSIHDAIRCYSEDISGIQMIVREGTSYISPNIVAGGYDDDEI